MFANVKHESGGVLLSPHVHGLVFGVDISAAAEAAVRKLKWRFQTRFPEVPGVHFDWVGPTDMDLIRAVHYPWKPPSRSKTLYKNVTLGKANLHESEANDRFVRYLRMAQILSVVRADRIMFGSGQGGSIRSDVVREAQCWLRRGDKDRAPPIHSDALATYHMDLLDRVGLKRFKLPIIRYRKK